MLEFRFKKKASYRSFDALQIIDKSRAKDKVNCEILNRLTYNIRFRARLSDFTMGNVFKILNS